MREISTSDLEDFFKKQNKNNLQEAFDKFEDNMADDYHPFTQFMRKTIKEKGLQQQNVFIAADISNQYGRKLISMEKITKQRDIVLRLCLAAHFSLNEVNTALRYYGMSPLYARIKRDVVLIISFNEKTYEIEDVNNRLLQYDLEPLKGCREAE